MAEDHQRAMRVAYTRQRTPMTYVFLRHSMLYVPSRDNRESFCLGIREGLDRFLRCHVHDFLVSPNFKSSYSIFDLRRLCYKQWDIIHSFEAQSDYAYSPQRFYPKGSYDLNKFIPNQVILLRRYDNSAELVI